METVRRRNVKASPQTDGDFQESEGTMTTNVETDIRPASSVGPGSAETPSSPRRYWIAGMFFTRNERVWNVVRLSGRVLGSTLGLIIILALYTLIGALLFVALEAPHEKAVRSRISEERHTLLVSMWNITKINTSMSKDDFIKYGEKILNEYTNEVVLASQAGISSETESPKKWNFWGSVFYSLTVYTTIGYGHIAPATDPGRIATMFYATIGIPLCLVVLVKVGKIFTRILKLAASLTRRTIARIKVACRRKLKKEVPPEETAPTDEEEGPSFQPDLNELVNLYEQQDSAFDVPVVAALVLVIIYMLLGAALYRLWENWGYTEAVYFIFISISTIGFGDILPEHPKFFLLVSVYIFVGLSLVSMVVNVLMDNMAEKIDEAQEKIKELAKKDDDKSEGHVSSSGDDEASKQEVKSEVTSEPKKKDKKDSPKKTQPEGMQRVDKIDLSCIGACSKDDRD